MRTRRWRWRLRRFIEQRVACKYGPRWWRRGTITTTPSGWTTYRDVVFTGTQRLSGGESFFHCRFESPSSEEQA